MTRYQWLVLAAAWLGWGFDVFDALLFNFVAPNTVPVLLGLEPGSAVARDATVLWTSLPFSLGATTVIFGKHIDKLPQDRAKNIRTLPVWLGDPLARASVVAMIALQYALVLWLVLGGRLGPALLLVVGAMPAARRVIATYRAPRPQGPPVWFPAKVWPLWFVAFAFDHNRRFGLLFVLGLVLDALWVRFGVATALA